MARHSLFFPLLFLVPLLHVLPGCTSSLDLSATRGDQSIHFGDAGCAVSLTGNTDHGPSALDVTCPPTLQGVGGKPTLHLSTPLATQTGATLPLQDANFRLPGYQPGQFLIITYKSGDQQITCDPRQATGGITYTSIPTPTAGGILSGRFTADAALLDCQGGGSGPMTLSGSLDMVAPVN